jgi:ADP-ribosyl-[dinitrogen reductase] hydrolase
MTEPTDATDRTSTSSESAESVASRRPSSPRADRSMRQRLEALHRGGLLRVAALPSPPSSRPDDGTAPSADRVAGILLGTAIGDALGNTSESCTPHDRRASHGEIRGYLANRNAQHAHVGLPSDDTQLAVWLLDELLERPEPEAHRLASAWRRGRIFGIGRTMRSYLGALDARAGWRADASIAWSARQSSAGNGALMRIAGAVLPYAWTLDAAMLDTVVYTSAATHDDPSSTAACVAFAEILRRILLSGGGCVEPGFFWRTYVEVAASVEGRTRLASRVPGCSFVGSVAELVERQVPAAIEAGESVLEAGRRWYSGAFLLETVPTVLHLLELHAGDPETAIVRAVNDTWDNDTVAAIVGAVVGALHGARAFPETWRRGLLGRTSVDDDGQLVRSYARLVAHGGARVADPRALPIGEYA